MKRKRRVRATPPRVMLIAWVLPKTYDKLEELVATVKRARSGWARRLDPEKEDVAGRMLDQMVPTFVAKIEEKLTQKPARGRRARKRATGARRGDRKRAT